MAFSLSFFFRELKRRKVTRVAVVYVLVGLGVIEAAQMLLPVLQLEAGYPYIVIFVLFGFPITLVTAWAYEMTPQGLKKEKEVDHSPPGSHAKGNKLYFIIGGLLAVSLAGVAIWPKDGRDSPLQGTGSAPPIPGPSIAVLAFTNDSGDPDQDYFSSGLTDDIITELSKYTELVVITGTLSPGSDSQSTQASAMDAAPKARYMLQGSVRKAGDRIRVTVQLSDAFKGTLVWGDHYQRDLTVTGLFDLQDELAQKVVNALAGSYGALARAELAEARRKPPKSLGSYDCVLQTYEYLHAHDSPHHQRARDCLGNVVEVDLDYADGWAWLAYLYGEEFHHRRNERPDLYNSRDRALEAAERAVDLDPANQVAQGALALASMLRGDTVRGRSAAYRAIQLNPNNALWLGLLGTWLSWSGDFDHGLPMVQKALALDSSPPPWLHMAIFLEHYHNGRYEAALTEAQIIETGDFRAPTYLAAVHGQMGNVPEAKRALEELRALFPGSFDDLGQELVERNGFEPQLAGHIVAGLRKAAGEDGQDRGQHP